MPLRNGALGLRIGPVTSRNQSPRRPLELIPGYFPVSQFVSRFGAHNYPVRRNRDWVCKYLIEHAYQR